jgi:tetratricopeptide (TPR) repeat protein
VAGITTKTKILTGALAMLLAGALPASAAHSTKKSSKAKMDPAAKVLLSKGLGELNRGEFTAAISSLNKAVRIQGSVPSYFLLGWAHYQRGFKMGSVAAADRDDAQSAIDAYTVAISRDPKLSELPDPARLYFSLALCQEAVESYDRALEAYKTALRLAPNKALIALHAARLRLKMKDEDKAMSNLNMALEKARRAGNEGAIAELVKKDPAFTLLFADASMRRVLGIKGRATDELVASADFRGEEMRDAVRDVAPRAMAPQDLTVTNKLSAADLEYKFRRYQNSISLFDEALRLNSERMTLSVDQLATVEEKVGTAYNKLGQSGPAAVALKRALESNPNNAAARYQLALAYAMSGMTSLSLETVKECFASTTSSAELRRYVLQAKTDVELEGVRDLPAFKKVLAAVADRVALR